MNRNFKSFAEYKKMWNEVAGVSRTEINFPVDYVPLGNLLTFTPGNALRTRALVWVTTEGLMQASRGRNKLFLLVKPELEKLQNTILPMTGAHGIKNQQPTQKVAGVQEMARNVIGNWGRDPEDSFTVHDLFSKEAWARMPILKQVKLDGKGILEYYFENFEPREMVLEKDNDKAGKWTIDLTKMNSKIQEAELSPFYFGGFDGYIQYVEKGDWLEDHEKRAAFSPNQQFGFDLTPEKRFSKDAGGFIDMEDEDKFGKRGKESFHFQGGSSNVDAKRAKKIIDSMRDDFTYKAKQILADDPNDPIKHVDPRDIEKWKKILTLKQYIASREASIHEKGLGRPGLSRRAGFPKYNEGPAVMPLPKNVSVETFQKLIRDGLNTPMKRTVDSFSNPGAFGPQIDDPSNAPPNGGWFCIQGNKLTFHMNQDMQDAVYSYIFQDVQENEGTVNSNFHLKAIPAFDIAKPAENSTKISLDPLLTQGIKSNPALAKDLKMYINHLRKDKVNSNEYIKNVVPDMVEVDTLSWETDPNLQKLLNNGYEWELKTTQDIINKHPFNRKAKQAFLVKNKSRYRLTLEKDRKWYLHLLTNKIDPDADADVPAFGAIGTSFLSGSRGMRFSGGKQASHFEMNPAGKNTWQKLEQRLLQGAKGGLGEGGSKLDDDDASGSGPFDNVMELPSVKYAVKQAKKYFDDQNYKNTFFTGIKKYTKASDLFNDDGISLEAWGAEYLPSISNDPAFQIGWIDQKEINAFVGRKQKNKENEKVWTLDSELQKDIDTEHEFDGKKRVKGKGIYSILHRGGIKDDDPEKSKEMYSNIVSWINQNKHLAEDGMIIDLIWDTDPDVARAFAENGYEWRARKIEKYVLAKMNRYADAEQSEYASSINTGGGEDGTGDVDVEDKGYNAEKKGKYKFNSTPIKPEDLAKTIGIDTQKQLPSFNTFGGNQQVSTPVAAQQKQTNIPVGSMIDDDEEDSPSPVVAQQKQTNIPPSSMIDDDEEDSPSPVAAQQKQLSPLNTFGGNQPLSKPVMAQQKRTNIPVSSMIDDDE